MAVVVQSDVELNQNVNKSYPSELHQKVIRNDAKIPKISRKVVWTLGISQNEKFSARIEFVVVPSPVVVVVCDVDDVHLFAPFLEQSHALASAVGAPQIATTR